MKRTQVDTNPYKLSDTNKRYQTYDYYLKYTFGGKCMKIPLDAGFTCPNIDGRCSVGGCIFCSERGSGEHIRANLRIGEQVRDGLERLKDSDGAIAYFQNFTNTYAPVSVLKERYDAALIDDRIVALAIGTRPDCIDEDVCELIASYRDRVDVWVELGVQTASDRTARIINRGYETDVYERAAALLDSYGIPHVVHIMIGLPDETENELSETIALINRTRPWGLKIHSVYVCRGTRLEDMYRRGEYEPIDMDTYVNRAVRVLRSIPKETVIHRLTGDCPQELLVAPLWNTEKNAVLMAINEKIHLSEG
jgi:radical SAM protein (TIGR01212 family)